MAEPPKKPTSSSKPNSPSPPARPPARVLPTPRPLNVAPVAKPESAGTAAATPSSLSKEALLDAIGKVVRHEITWAEALGVTRSEAFGIAQSAHRLFEFGQHERARQMVEGLVTLNPKVGAFHALLGAMSGRMGDESAAEAAYSAALAVEPDNLAARVNRAEMRLKRGDVGEALDDLVAATRIDPTGKTALGKRAQSLARVTSQALRELLHRPKPSPKPTSSKPAPRR